MIVCYKFAYTVIGKCGYSPSSGAFVNAPDLKRILSPPYSKNITAPNDTILLCLQSDDEYVHRPKPNLAENQADVLYRFLYPLIYLEEMYR